MGQLDNDDAAAADDEEEEGEEGDVIFLWICAMRIHVIFRWDLEKYMK